jgi:hypothetical protein
MAASAPAGGSLRRLSGPVLDQSRTGTESHQGVERGTHTEPGSVTGGDQDGHQENRAT